MIRSQFINGVKLACLCYLSDGVAFVGSHFGDSQLILLLTAANSNNEYLELVYVIYSTFRHHFAVDSILLTIRFCLVFD